MQFLNDASAFCSKANRLFGLSVMTVTCGKVEVFCLGTSTVEFFFSLLAEALVEIAEIPLLRNQVSCSTSECQIQMVIGY